MADNDKRDNAGTDADEATAGSTSGAERRRRRGGRSSKKPEPPDPSKLKFFKLIPDDTKIDFVGNRRRGIMFSVMLVLLSLAMMGFNYSKTGSVLNFGIDFQGGSSVRLALTKEVDINEIRDILDDEGYSGSSAVAVPDADNEVLIRVKQTITKTEEQLGACRDALGSIEGASLLPANEQGFVHPEGSSKIFMKFDAQPRYLDIERLMTEAGCEGTASPGVTLASSDLDEEGPQAVPIEFALIGVGTDISHVLDKRLGDGTVDHIVASETVGAKVGNQLKLDGAKAMMFAIGFIFLFVMIRFDLRFAPGGIVALAHDALIVIGAFALTGKEFNLQSIAAVLTIIGYSINDTIVVFDRVRERVALHRDDPIEETTNTALNETLSRTILTSTTTLIVVLTTWILGSGPIKDFSFALFIGLIAGTYSSLFVASPVFLWVNEKIYKGKGHLLTADKDAAREGTGTLLGGAAAQDIDERRAAEAAEAAAEADIETPAGGVVSAALPEVVGADDGGEGGSALDGVKVADTDKGAGERKTRRRRRRKD